MRGRGACVASGMCMAGVMLGGHAWHGACVSHMPPPPADTTRYGDTVNERAVRILLECILILFASLIKVAPMTSLATL